MRAHLIQCLECQHVNVSSDEKNVHWVKSENY